MTPYLRDNPKAAVGPEGCYSRRDLGQPRPQRSLGDAVAISKRLKIPIVATYELALYCGKQGGPLPCYAYWRRSKLPLWMGKATPALHGSSVEENGKNYMYRCALRLSGEEPKRKPSISPAIPGSSVICALLREICTTVVWLPTAIWRNFVMGPEDAVERQKCCRPRW